ncbi:MAG TPA: serine hydrolase [Devosia sp.]
MLSQLVFRLSRISLARIFFAVFLALAVALPAHAESVPRKYAGIVIDAKSGKVLYESAADAARYPASVTKVMTLYVLFQELNAGNIKLSDKMTVSAYAAKAVPTKLGLKAGSKITVENAIKALVTLSANDMARVIAEHISGSEAKFAERMTATARALGMSRTTYRNASGLPDSRQITTVRDQAILGIAIYQHFPQYYEFFQTKSFSYGKRTYGNHNRLLGERGVDGIKTGYTNASGFNLLTAARMDGHHIVVAAFGFDKSGSRDAKVRELVKKYGTKGRSGGYLDVAMIPVPGRKGATVQVASTDPVPVTPLPYPAWRLDQQVMAASAPVTHVEATMVANASVAPVSRPADLTTRVPTPATAAISSVAPTPRDRPLDVIGAWISDTLQLGAEPAPLGQTAPSAPLLPPVGIGDAGEPIDLMTSGAIGEGDITEVAAITEQPMPAPIATAPAASAWIVQIGAAPTEAGASSLLSDAASGVSALGNMKSYVEKFEKNGQVFFRARFAGFAGRDDAKAMCSELKKVKMSCLAMQS